MRQSGFHSGNDDSAINYFHQRITNLSPPKSSREELLLEIYQQLFEKHSGLSAVDSKRGTEYTTEALFLSSRDVTVQTPTRPGRPYYRQVCHPWHWIPASRPE